MGFTVQDISTRAGLVLTDPDAVRWTLAERTLWVNEGVAALLVLKPSAYMRHQVVTLSPGAAQAAPGDCRSLVEVRQSVRPGGGRARECQRVSRAMLSLTEPEWAAQPGRGEVRNWSYDDYDPLRFYVYPPQPDTPGTAELVYHAAMPWLALTATVPLLDDYAPPLVNYLLFRAYSKDAEFAGNGTVAQAYYQAFASALS
jgi:hypothetical protein